MASSPCVNPSSIPSQALDSVTDFVVNARFLSRRMTGVERYGMEVTRRLPGRARLLKEPSFGGSAGLGAHLWEQILLPLYISGSQVLWSPANSGPLAVSNQVVTIHDISPIDHPEWFTPRFALWYGFLLPRLAWRVRRVITDSNFSRQRIIAVSRCPAERVLVIPPGVDRGRFHPLSDEAVERCQARHSLPDDYVLFLGSEDPRKNLPSLYRALEILRTRHPHVALVVAGGSVHTLRRQVAGWNPDGVVRLGYVPDADLPALYNGALVFAMPSHYEGFGLPVLEAMACGVPVLASNRTALPEVVGSAGLLVDPDRPDQIATALDRLLIDPDLRHSLRNQGLVRAQSFTWEKTASAVLAVLENAAAGGSRDPR